jgi:hypothetical protein
MASAGWPAALIVLTVMVIIYWTGVLGIDPAGFGY